MRANWRVKVVLELKKKLVNDQFKSFLDVLAAPEQCRLFETDNMEHHWPPYWCCPRGMDCIGWLAWLEPMGPFGRDRRVAEYREQVSHFARPHKISSWPISDMSSQNTIQESTHCLRQIETSLRCKFSNRSRVECSRFRI